LFLNQHLEQWPRKDDLLNSVLLHNGSQSFPCSVALVGVGTDENALVQGLLLSDARSIVCCKSILSLIGQMKKSDEHDSSVPLAKCLLIFSMMLARLMKERLKLPLKL